MAMMKEDAKCMVMMVMMVTMLGERGGAEGVREGPVREVILQMMVMVAIKHHVVMVLMTITTGEGEIVVMTTGMASENTSRRRHVMT